MHHDIISADTIELLVGNRRVRNNSHMLGVGTVEMYGFGLHEAKLITILTKKKGKK